MALKILLADDSMTAQNMGKKILTDAGYEVIAVSNGAAAVKKIAEISPQLCILDIYMPGYTGLEVCEKVKSSSATSRMPVLLTVGKMEPYKPEEGARVRADGVIVKPFEASELLRAVHRFSQRIAGSSPRSASSHHPSTSSTFERTVKLTREQIQAYMDPSRPNWNGGTATSDAVEEVVASTKTASTSDTMPTFAVTAVADETTPALAGIHEAAVMADLAAVPKFEEEISRDLPVDLPQVALPEAPLTSASAVLPGFVDYLIRAETTSATGEFVEYTAERRPEAMSMTDALAAAQAIGYKIPAMDPALEVAPRVEIEATPDPQLEAVEDLAVANATEEGLQPTSRASESEGVMTTTDPNLAPMEGLIDAVQPLEGGRLVISPRPPVEQPSFAEAAVPVPTPETTELSSAPISESVQEISTPLVAIAETRGLLPSRKAKKPREMRAIAPAPVVVSPSATESPSNGKADVTQEISAVLDLLGQTTSAAIPTFAESRVAPSADFAEASSSSPVTASRVWMAEEVVLSGYEATLSLENEMRLAYAPRVVEPAVLSDPVIDSEERVSRLQAEMAAVLAEEQVREDKFAPKAGGSESGGSSSDAGTSPTEELAAAMAAAFGGALPQEDLARAEETQSISEEVRRFALGDAYKPKPGFGGAAIDDPVDKVVNSAKLSAAIGRALDRLKPQLVAEILKELNAKDEE